MAIKKKTINFEHWEAVVEVNNSLETKESMKEQLLFFMGGQRLIDGAEGDIEEAYLKSLGGQLIRLSMDYNLYGVLEEIDEMEGWLPVRGKYGVKLISVDPWDFDESFFDIKDEQL